MEKKPYLPGTMVFWLSEAKPRWVIEWQPGNGDGCYWIVDGAGNSATAAPSELKTRAGRVAA